jgi:hypothetical protein
MFKGEQRRTQGCFGGEPNSPCKVAVKKQVRVISGRLQLAQFLLILSERFLARTPVAMAFLTSL